MHGLPTVGMAQLMARCAFRHLDSKTLHRRFGTGLPFVTVLLFGCSVSPLAMDGHGRPEWPEDSDVASELASDVAPLEVGPRFSVLTYNVQSRPILDRATSEHRNRTISPLLNQYDVVGIQESFVRTDLLLSDAQHESKVPFSARRHFWSLTGPGLATLAKYPVVARDAVHYGAYAGVADSVASKGVQFTRLNIDGHFVDVYVTHMQAGDSVQENRARFDQGNELIEFVREHSSTAYPVLIMGDFNMGPARPEKPWESFRPNHYSNEWDRQFRTETFQRIQDTLGLRFLSDELLPEKPDYIEGILFRSGCQSELTAESFAIDTDRFQDAAGLPLSDSTPMVGTFRLLPATSPACTNEPLVPAFPRPHTVRFYADCDYRGPFLEVSEGHAVSLGATSFNDRISSVQVGAGSQVVLSEHDGGLGQRLALQSPGSGCLVGAGWNDRVSHVNVVAAP